MASSDPFANIKAQDMWGKNSAPIWIASSFFLKRNLSSSLFPLKMGKEESYATLTTLKRSLMGALPLKNSTFYDIDQLNSWEREYLFEHFLATYDAGNTACKSGMVIDQSGNFFAIINDKEHLIMCSLDTQANWEAAWKKLSTIEVELSNKLSFAYSRAFGYLTSNPSNSGTALTVRALLHIPSLIHLGQLDDVLVKEIDNEISVYGLMGQSNFIGDIAIIQNRFTLGLTEDDILRRVHKSATTLINVEKRLRNTLIEAPHDLILDRVRRSVGLLKYSYQIERKEVLSALSFIKLGIDLNWIVGMGMKEINKLFFEMYHARSIVSQCGKVVHDQTPHKRAEFLREALKSISIDL